MVLFEKKDKKIRSMTNRIIFSKDFELNFDSLKTAWGKEIQKRKKKTK